MFAAQHRRSPPTLGYSLLPVAMIEFVLTFLWREIDSNSWSRRKRFCGAEPIKVRGIPDTSRFVLMKHNVINYQLG